MTWHLLFVTILKKPVLSREPQEQKTGGLSRRPLSLRMPVSECAQADVDYVIPIPEISGSCFRSSVQSAPWEELTFHLQW